MSTLIPVIGSVGGGEREKKPRVIIVGGGFAGAAISHALDKAKGIEITLIDTKEYLENTVGVIRAMVDPASVPPQSLHFPHSAYLPHGDIIIGEVAEATPHHLVISLPKAASTSPNLMSSSSGSPALSSSSSSSSSFLMISYDLLVICTGKNYSLVPSQPRSCQSLSLLRARSLIEESAVIQRSKHIIVIGGRSSGVELASTVASRHGATKRVTLIEEQSSLLANGLPSAAGTYAWKALEAAGVSVITGEHVVSVIHSPSNNQLTVTTGKGTKLTADLVYSCTGSKPNTSWLKQHFSDCLDESGRVKVLPTLQLEGHPNVFAAGDVVSFQEEKLAATAMQHASVVAKNVLTLATIFSANSGSSSLLEIAEAEASSALSKLKQYHKVPIPMIIPLGTDDAIGLDTGSTTCAGFGAKMASLKRKNDAAMLKFLPKAIQSDIDSAQPSIPQPLSISTNRSSSGYDLASLQDDLSRSNQTILLRFVSSPLQKHIAKACLSHGLQIHVVVSPTEVSEATNDLRYVENRVIITADIPERPNISHILASSRCVVLPLWPAQHDDEFATELAEETKELSEAIKQAKVAHLIVLCPSSSGCTQKKQQGQRQQEGGNNNCNCIQCILERCILTLKKVMPKMTLIYHEPEFKSPFILSTLQGIQLHRTISLPLGVSDNNNPSRLTVSLIDTSDLVCAILGILEHPEKHDGETYRLTGPEALSGPDLSTFISRATGVDITYSEITADSAFEQMATEGISPAVARLLTFCARPSHSCTTADMLSLLPQGQKPQSFSQFARTKRAMFLAGRDNEEIDLDEILKAPSQIGKLVNSAASGQRAIHTELDMNEIILGEKIGAGASATVYKATYRGALVAVKQFKPSVIEFEPETFRHEVTIISILRHPNLVSCIGACTKTPETPWIIFEYMPRGSLDNLFKTFQPAGPFNLSLQIHIVIDIARAMRFLHNAGLVHGDLKPANLLVSDNLQIKLTDFDTCRVVSPKMRGALGTPDYIAPESFAKKNYTEKVDVYAFGITIWQVATRESPYPKLTAMEIPDAVIKGERPAALPGHMFKDLMSSCWQEKPSKRPKFNKICDEIDAISQQDFNRRLLQKHAVSVAEIPPPNSNPFSNRPMNISQSQPNIPPSHLQQQQQQQQKQQNLSSSQLIPERSKTPPGAVTHKRPINRSISTTPDNVVPISGPLSSLAAAYDSSHSSANRSKSPPIGTDIGPPQSSPPPPNTNSNSTFIPPPNVPPPPLKTSSSGQHYSLPFTAKPSSSTTLTRKNSSGGDTSSSGSNNLSPLSSPELITQSPSNPYSSMSRSHSLESGFASIGKNESPSTNEPPPIDIPPPSSQIPSSNSSSNTFVVYPPPLPLSSITLRSSTDGTGTNKNSPSPPPIDVDIPPPPIAPPTNKQQQQQQILSRRSLQLNEKPNDIVSPPTSPSPPPPTTLQLQNNIDDIPPPPPPPLTPSSGTSSPQIIKRMSLLLPPKSSELTATTTDDIPPPPLTPQTLKRRSLQLSSQTPTNDQQQQTTTTTTIELDDIPPPPQPPPLSQNDSVSSPSSKTLKRHSLQLPQKINDFIPPPPSPPSLQQSIQQQLQSQQNEAEDIPPPPLIPTTETKATPKTTNIPPSKISPPTSNLPPPIFPKKPPTPVVTIQEPVETTTKKKHFVSQLFHRSHDSQSSGSNSNSGSGNGGIGFSTSKQVTKAQSLQQLPINNVNIHRPPPNSTQILTGVRPPSKPNLQAPPSLQLPSNKSTNKNIHQQPQQHVNPTNPITTSNPK